MNVHKLSWRVDNASMHLASRILTDSLLGLQRATHNSSRWSVLSSTWRHGNRISAGKLQRGKPTRSDIMRTWCRILKDFNGGQIASIITLKSTARYCRFEVKLNGEMYGLNEMTIAFAKPEMRSHVSVRLHWSVLRSWRLKYLTLLIGKNPTLSGPLTGIGEETC